MTRTLQLHRPPAAPTIAPVEVVAGEETLDLGAWAATYVDIALEISGVLPRGQHG
jgi:hypothetical protein